MSDPAETAIITGPPEPAGAFEARTAVERGPERAAAPAAERGPAPAPESEPVLESVPAAQESAVFSNRVLLLFGTQVFTTFIGILNGLFLARLVGPSGKGDFYLLTILPSALMVMIQAGLPQAFGFFAARGQAAGLVRKSITLTCALAGPTMFVTIALMGTLRATFLHGLPVTWILLALCVLPLALNATLTTGIVIGRQEVRWYAAVSLVQYIGMTILFAVVVGMLGLGVPGAVAVSVGTYAVLTGGLLVAARRVVRGITAPARVSYRELFRYGLPFYPGSLTMFFDYRADVFLLAWLVADAAAPLGYYSLAVSMAELSFFFPNAVAALFFPRIAGASREDADREAASASRLTLLITAFSAIATIPVALVIVYGLLPRFEPALAPFLILLPGVIALSITKVLTGYVSGLGHTGITSVVNVGAFAINVAANVILIPRFGIVGAATASVISYTLSSVAYSVVSSRLARTPIYRFWLPRADDVRYALSMSADLIGRLRARIAQARA